MTNKTTNQQQSESQSLASLQWFVSTPRELEYFLQIEHDSEAIQMINLTRHEYIQLKLHLAKMRHCVIPAKGPDNADSNELGFYIEEPIWDEVEPKQLEEMGLVTA